jgi:hypothetical protein
LETGGSWWPKVFNLLTIGTVFGQFVTLVVIFAANQSAKLHQWVTLMPLPFITLALWLAAHKFLASQGASHYYLWHSPYVLKNHFKKNAGQYIKTEDVLNEVGNATISPTSPTLPATSEDEFKGTSLSETIFNPVLVNPLMKVWVSDDYVSLLPAYYKPKYESMDEYIAIHYPERVAAAAVSSPSYETKDISYRTLQRRTVMLQQLYTQGRPQMMMRMHSQAFSNGSMPDDSGLSMSTSNSTAIGTSGGVGGGEYRPLYHSPFQGHQGPGSQRMASVDSSAVGSESWNVDGSNGGMMMMMPPEYRPSGGGSVSSGYYAGPAAMHYQMQQQPGLSPSLSMGSVAQQQQYQQYHQQQFQHQSQQYHQHQQNQQQQQVISNGQMRGVNMGGQRPYHPQQQQQQQQMYQMPPSSSGGAPVYSRESSLPSMQQRRDYY